MKKILFSLILFFTVFIVKAQDFPLVNKGQQLTKSFGTDTLLSYIIKNSNINGNAGFLMLTGTAKSGLFTSKDTTYLISNKKMFIPDAIFNSIKLQTGAGAGKVILSDANGNFSWGSVGGASGGNADSLDGKEGWYYKDSLFIDYCSGCAKISKWLAKGDTIFIDTLGGGGVTDTTSLSNRINLKRDLTDLTFDSIQTNFISPLDSVSVGLHNHSNSSLVVFEDGTPHIGSINAYFGTYKGVDYNAGNYYKNGLWYRSTTYKPLCFFENLNAGTFEFWAENSGTIGSSITWSTRKAYINSVGSFYGYDLHASNSLHVTDSIYNTALTNSLAGKSDTANVALLATANTFTKANTFNSSVLLPNITSTTTASKILVQENNIIKQDDLIDMAQATVPRMQVDTFSVNLNTTVRGGETFYESKQAMLDDASIIMPTATAGIGNISVGDGATWVWFTWTTDGVVTLINKSTDVDSADTDVKFCIFDSGTTITIRNRLGATKYVRFNLHYSIN